MHFQFYLNTSEPVMATAAAAEGWEQTFTVVAPPTEVGFIHTLHCLVFSENAPPVRRYKKYFRMNLT